MNMRSSTKRQEQGQDIQNARMDAMGYRMAEKKVPLTQREFRMEDQMQEMCAQIQTMGNMLQIIQPRPTNSTVKDLLQDTEVSLPKPVKDVTLKPKKSSIVTAAKPSCSRQQPTKYLPQHPPHSSNIEAVPTSKTISLTASTRKKEHICDIITIATSSMGITGLREPTNIPGRERAHVHCRPKRAHVHQQSD